MTIEVSIETQIAAIEREIVARKRIYQRWVKQERITQARADQAIDEMRAVAKSLRELARIKEALHDGRVDGFWEIRPAPEQENA